MADDGSSFDEEARPRAPARRKPAAARPQAVRRRASSSRVFAKLGMIALVSFIISGMLTWVVAFSIEELPTIKSFIGRKNYSDILFLVFLVGFMLTLATSAWAFLTKEELTGQVETRQFERREKKLWNEALAPPKLTPQQQAALDRQKQKRLEEEQRLLAEKEGPPSLDDVLAASLDTNPTVAGSVAPVALGGRAQQQKAQLMSFLSTGLEQVVQTRPKLDTFNKFGVNLFLAGASDALAQQGNLSEEEMNGIFAESAAVLGTKADQAHKFIAGMQDYMGNPKYLGMIESGRDAMMAHLRGDGAATKQLDKALNSWNSRKDEGKGSSGTIAVMFTDMVGSTALTQQHGDAAAQEVVRRHNRIVRQALTTYQGREVKHTGDGIMASFANVANSVEAAIFIMRKVTAENATSKIPLGLKIGINAGEPIVEDDDLFGTTVQLSARICDKATNHQVLVSETVKGICQGKSMGFAARGTREMKGFKEPIPLYEAIWQESGAAAA
jgi:class 3 adenylate cyclase